MTSEVLNGINDQKERERLEVLNDYGILDTKPEKEFDELTALAAELCDAPIARIHLIDKDRQWVKSASGDEHINTTMPRENSVCHYTVKKEAVLEVEDLLQHPTFCERPYVAGYPNLKYYLGAPLISPDGYTIGSLCVLDYKSRKMGDRQIKQLTILASEVIARFELLKKNRKLEKLNEHKVNLMKMLSHDMRSPINGIVGLSNILASEIESPDHLELVDLMEQSAHQLNHMINEILSYSLIETKGFQLSTEPVDLNEIIHSMQKLYKPVAQSKGVKLTFQNEVIDPVSLDKNKFEQIYGNLLSNSLKFTESGGTVNSAFSISNDGEGQSLILEVSDTGIGMDEDTADNIFGDDTITINPGTNGEKSTGIGTSIIKYLVQLHMGAINVKSKKGEGTTFTVSIPISKI